MLSSGERGSELFFFDPPLLVLLHKTGRLRKANVNNRIMKVYGRNVKWRNRLLSIRTEYERKKRVLKEKNNVQNSFEVREDDGILTELCKIYIVSKWQVAQRHDVAWEAAWHSMSSCKKNINGKNIDLRFKYITQWEIATHSMLNVEMLCVVPFFEQVIDLLSIVWSGAWKKHVMFELSEEIVSDMIVYNNLATSIQYVYIDMDVAYGIGICWINTPKVHMCSECHCSHIMYIHICIYTHIDGLAFAFLVLLYASMIWMVPK